MAGHGWAESRRVAEAFISRMKIEAYRNVKTKNLSGGNKRKVCTAISLIGSPKVKLFYLDWGKQESVGLQFVLMDEPTSGMDPGSRQLVREVIREAVEQGQSVLMTSHSMTECDLLCDRLAIMVSGQIVLEGDPQHLKETEGGGYKINVKLSDPARRQDLDTFLQSSFRLGA